jgi:radical SAM superfamily enzyme YgiQ (UPF0313 family)
MVEHEKGATKVGLVQINNSFSNQNYLPYSVGLLQAYIEEHSEHSERYEFLVPIYKRMPVDDMVAHLREADVIGFSTYVWNIRISLEVARRVKEQNPEVLIVFGGPQVPDKAEGFVGAHDFIDLCCHGEGEQVFNMILDNCRTRAWEDIPSLSYLDKNGTFVTTKKIGRLKDLTLIPSPFLSGAFATVMEANPEEQWLALWETNRGCPFSCTFCDWGSATASKLNRFEMDRLLGEVDWFAKHRIEFVFCCDANFGILPRDVEIAQYVADSKGDRGYPHALSVQNTKNATERAYLTQKILNEAGLNKGVTIALQTVDDNTLNSIKRGNISSETYQELQRRFTKDGVETYTDIILGLPGETYETFADGVSHIIDNGQHNRIQFNNLSILPNAEMGDPEYQRQYGMQTVETKTINIHGSLEDSEEEIAEFQDLVIATDAMPREDWAKVRAFSWMAALLHFDKVAQIPFVLLHEICSVSYRELIESLMLVDDETYPTLMEVNRFFYDKAKDIQGGGAEYCDSKEWLNIWWPADEYILIKICQEDKLQTFYREIGEVLAAFLTERFLDFPAAVLAEALELNRSLIKTPFQTEDLEIQVSYNIWEYYQSILKGETLPLEEGEFRYRIDRTGEIWDSWGDWCQKVIWYGNKKGAYLYGNDAIEAQIAGHF